MSTQPPEDDPRNIGKGPKRPLPPDMRDIASLCAHMVDHLRNWARDSGPDASWTPMIVACCENGDIVPITLSDTSEAAKENFARQARALFRQWGVTHYVSALEAWIATVAHDKSLAALRPSQREDREEVFVVCATDRTGANHGACLEIVRDPTTGGIIALKEKEAVNGVRVAGAHANLGGRFTSLLEDEDAEGEEEASRQDHNERSTGPGPESELRAQELLQSLLDPPEELRSRIDDFDALKLEGRSLLALIDAKIANGEDPKDDPDLGERIRLVAQRVLQAMRDS